MEIWEVGEISITRSSVVGRRGHGKEEERIEAYGGKP
jgi:hypothetical protein